MPEDRCAVRCFDVTHEPLNALLAKSNNNRCPHSCVWVCSSDPADPRTPLPLPMESDSSAEHCHAGLAVPCGMPFRRGPSHEHVRPSAGQSLNACAHPLAACWSRAAPPPHGGPPPGDPPMTAVALPSLPGISGISRDSRDSGDPGDSRAHSLQGPGVREQCEQARGHARAVEGVAGQVEQKPTPPLVCLGLLLRTR
jgi:hypothetical protein